MNDYEQELLQQHQHQQRLQQQDASLLQQQQHLHQQQQQMNQHHHTNATINDTNAHQYAQLHAANSGEGDVEEGGELNLQVLNVIFNSNLANETVHAQQHAQQAQQHAAQQIQLQ